MLGVHTRVAVNSSAVDVIEKALQQKVETLSNYNDNPVAALRQVFKGFDKNGSGKIGQDEFVEAMGKLNFSNTNSEVTALFQRYDLDGSGYIELQEFGNALFKRGDKKVRATSTIGKVREVLAARAGGFQALQDIARQFKIIDKNKDGKLSREEMTKGLELLLRGYGLSLSRAENERVFQAFDADGNGFISYTEFIRGVRGSMNDDRVAIVKTAFTMLDADGDGVITREDVANKYNVKQHPRVLSGELTEQQAADMFMQAWDKHHSGHVNLDDFVEYFEWISCNIDDDDHFELLIRNAFHISGGKGWTENTTNRRVLATLRDGSQRVLEIKNDLGIGKTDTAAMLANLKQQGFDVVSVQVVGAN